MISICQGTDRGQSKEAYNRNKLKRVFSTPHHEINQQQEIQSYNLALQNVKEFCVRSLGTKGPKFH
jgi:hypothetical protein